MYCENLTEVKDQFENILEENDWFETEATCFEPKLFSMLDENKLTYKNTISPKFLLASCENLIADERVDLIFERNIHRQVARTM